MRRPFAGVTRSTAYLALASFFADVSTELLYPILPVFLTETLHASGSVVGLVEGVAEATEHRAGFVRLAVGHPAEPEADCRVRLRPVRGSAWHQPAFAPP